MYDDQTSPGCWRPIKIRTRFYLYFFYEFFPVIVTSGT